MNIAEMVDEKLVSFGFEAGTKDDVLKGLGKMMYDAGKVEDLNQYINGLYEREAEFSTGIGNGIAIPHCKSDCVREAAFTLVKLNNPVEWETLDGRPVDYVNSWSNKLARRDCTYLYGSFQSGKMCKKERTGNQD